VRPRGRPQPEWWTYHVVDYPHCLAHGGCLEAHSRHAADQLLDGDAALGIMVKVYADNLSRALWDSLGRRQDSVCRDRWRCGRVVAAGHVEVRGSKVIM
jgi:hypothetical protein